MGNSQGSQVKRPTGPRPIQAQRQSLLEFKFESLNQSTFSVGTEDPDKGIDIDGNEGALQQLREQRFVVNIENLHTKANEIDFHQIIYEDVILSLFYQLDSINKIKLQLPHNSPENAACEPLTDSPTKHRVKTPIKKSSSKLLDEI